MLQEEHFQVYYIVLESRKPLGAAPTTGNTGGGASGYTYIGNGAGTQIGAIIFGTISSTTVINGGSCATLTIPTPGIYLFNFTISLGGAITYGFLYLTGTNLLSSSQTIFPFGINISATGPSSTGSCVINAVAGTYGLSINTSAGSLTATSYAYSFFTATRIA